MSTLSALFTARAVRVWVKGGLSLSNSAVPSAGVVTGTARALGVVGASSVTLTLDTPTITGSVTTEYQKNSAGWVAFIGGETVAMTDNDTLQFRGSGMVAGETYSVTATYSSYGLGGIQAAAATITAV